MRVPFSVCSMICLMAFFRLLARNISCSRGLKMAAVGRGEQGAGTVGGTVGGASTAPSPSSCSSAMVGGGVAITLVAWDSSLSVFSRESNFSFKTPHCSQSKTPRVNPQPITNTSRRVYSCSQSQLTFFAITSDSSVLSELFSYARPTLATKSFTVSHKTLENEQTHVLHCEIHNTRTYTNRQCL